MILATEEPGPGGGRESGDHGLGSERRERTGAGRLRLRAGPLRHRSLSHLLAAPLLAVLSTPLLAVPLLAVLSALVLAPLPLLAVVISEIHYNPPGGDASLEFIEVSSDTATPEDISGYHFSEGVIFQFPPGTVLSKGDILVVCADVDALKARYGIAASAIGFVGNFLGRLDNDGERLTLANRVGIPLRSVRFRDGGAWPTEADGTGHTLVLRNLRDDPSAPESWTWSPEPGGSPGRPNFGAGEAPPCEDSVLIEAGEIWRFARGVGPFSSPPDAWREPDFDDSAWESGPSGFGYGDRDDATILDDMLDGYTSVACRKEFFLSAEDLGAVELTLGMTYDDGFCAFANGTPFASVYCPPEASWDSVATGSHEAAGIEEPFPVPRGLLREGRNVLAIVGYNIDRSSLDFSLLPRLLGRRCAGGSGTEGPSGIVLNELYRSPLKGESWVELHNRGPANVDISGFLLTDDPDRPDPHVLPPGSSIPPGGFLVVEEAGSGLGLTAARQRLFLFSTAGTVERGPIVTATIFERPPPAGAGIAGYAEARFPDGGPLDWVTMTPTRGSPNVVEAVRDIVINEIFYHPPEKRRGEFLELHNRGSSWVDLSGFSFAAGIRYTFEDGVGLEPGGYLVVAQDPELLRETHGLEGALGPYEGQLADEGETIRLLDARGNPVDEVSYRDGGLWSEWADGDGSSLELIDPDQSNDAGTAWGASDESGKSRWERLSYTVDAYVPATESELHLLLVERGRCLIDDVSVSRAAGPNLIPNPGFETSTAPWIIEGTHQDSRRVTHDAHSGVACLELDASGKGDTSVNRIEIETSPRLSAGPYEVSLWARWLGGASLIVGHGEFTAGEWGGRPSPSVNLSGNTLGGRLRMTVPLDLGTPGEENSLRRRLREETGGTNLGPIIHAVSHVPPSPSPSSPIRIVARISDSDGVAAARAMYRERHAGGTFAAIELRAEPGSPGGGDGDGGGGGEGEGEGDGDGDGGNDVGGDVENGRSYAGELPGFGNGTKVVFYVEAEDAAGASRRFPEGAPEKTLLLQVQGPVDHPLDTVKLALDDARMQELATRRLHSNHLLDGAFVVDDAETYYHVGVRYRGSPWGRPERRSYRVRLPKDRRTSPGLRAVNLSSRENGPVEAASYFLIGRAGTAEKPVSTPLYRFVASYVNGAYQGTQRFIEPVGRDFLDKWFPGSEGPALKATARLAFNDSGAHVGYDGASFDFMGPDPESYRFYFHHVVDRSQDDWGRFAELMRVLDPRATSNEAHDAEIGSLLDIEGFLRVMVPRMFVSDWDTIGMGQGHNAYFILDSRDDRWETSPLDLNQAMPSGQLNFPVYPTFDRGYARLISRPGVRRLYTRIAWEYLNGTWSLAAARPFLDAMELAGVPMGEVRSFVAARGRIVGDQIRASTVVPFRILTNGGNDLSTDAVAVDLDGEAPVQVATILYRMNGVEQAVIAPTWTTPTRWRARVDLRAPRNDLQLLAFDGSGVLVGVADLAIETSAISGFLRADSNGNRLVEIGDAVTTLLYLFRGLPLECEDAADFDDDGAVSLSDAIATLDFLFRLGRPPEPPYPLPGDDPTPDGLECRA